MEFDVCELGPVRKGELASVRTFFSPPLRLRFPITVRNSDDETVRGVYQKLLADASTPIGDTEHQAAISRAVESLVYSDEPLALQSQLELLSGGVEMWSTTFKICHSVDLVVNLIDRNTPEVAEGLLKVLEKLEAGKCPVRLDTREVLSEVIVWAIHEMHERGDPEVVAITEPIVQSYPKPADPHKSLL